MIKRDQINIPTILEVFLCCMGGIWTSTTLLKVNSCTFKLTFKLASSVKEVNTLLCVMKNRDVPDKKQLKSFLR